MLGPTTETALKSHAGSFGYSAIQDSSYSKKICLDVCSKKRLYELAFLTEMENSALFLCNHKGCSNKFVKIDFSEGEP